LQRVRIAADQASSIIGHGRYHAELKNRTAPTGEVITCEVNLKIASWSDAYTKLYNLQDTLETVKKFSKDIFVSVFE